MTETNESILQASKKSKSWKHSLIWGGVALFVVGTAYGIFKFQTTGPEAAPPEIIEAQAGDIKLSLEGEGKIINPNIVNLSFFINGTLSEVNVSEGSFVEKGTVVAKLDTRDLIFDLRDAQSQVAIALANIKSKEAEITNQSLTIAQDELLSSKQSLLNTKSDLEKKRTQSYESAQINLEQTFPEIERSIRVVDEVFGIDQQSAPYTEVRAAFNNSILANEVKNLYEKTKRSRDTLWNEYLISTPLSSDQTIQFLLKTKAISLQAQDLIEMMLLLFDGAVASGNVAQTVIDSAENSVQSALSSINSEITTLNNAKQSIETAELNNKNGVTDAQRSLENTKLKLENNEKDFERLEINKQTGLSILQAQLSQAQVRVEKARYNLSLATLIAPIDGEIVTVNGKPGETIKAETASSDNAFIKILSQENFTTEVYVEEIDIARIKKEQRAIITLDAIPEEEFEGNVTHVSSISTIDGNGVTTYLVRVEITKDEENPIREGMTAYVEFIEAETENVITVPLTALVNDRFVVSETGDRIPVKVGLKDEKSAEIIEGLAEGTKIMSRPPRDGQNRDPQNARRTTGATGQEMSVEARMEMIGARLKENGNLPAGWDEMSTSEKQAALETLRNAQGDSRGGGGRLR